MAAASDLLHALQLKPLTTAICAIILAYVGRFFYGGYQARKRHRSLVCHMIFNI